MSIIANNSTVGIVNVGTNTARYVLARNTIETSYNQYNWKYVHVQSGYTLEQITGATSSWNNNTMIFTITLPSNTFNSTSNYWHIVIGSLANSCGTTNSFYFWVDIIVHWNGTQMVISDYGPNHSFSSNINIGLSNGNKTLSINISYPIISGSIPQLLYIYRRSA